MSKQVVKPGSDPLKTDPPTTTPKKFCYLRNSQHCAKLCWVVNRRRRSATRTQPHFAKWRMVNRANNLLKNSWCRPPRKTRGSAIAEEPRDALRQLKHYGCFLTELLTRSSANTEEACEHTVSWNRVKCCTNVRRIACENVCNRWMTFKVIQGDCRCHHLIGHILFPINLPL